MRINAHILDAWAHLPVAQALFETGSMALAADHLRVNRTTVDRRLRALEEALGGSVFERDGSRFVPTPLGRDLLRGFEAARDALGFLENDQSETGVGGPLRLTFPPHCAGLLAPALIRLARPDLGYSVEMSPSYAISNLQLREADIAVRILRNTPEEPLTGRRIRWLSGGLYQARSITPPDVFVLRPWEEDRPDYAPASAQHLPLLKATDIDTLRELIAAGGMGRLPHFFARPDTRLRCVSELPSENWQIWVLTHRNFARSPRIRRAMDVIGDAILAAPEIAHDPDPRNTGRPGQQHPA